MKFPIIYKYTEKGAIQQWQIIVAGDGFYTIEGIKGGKLTTSKPTVCTGKNIGKKNETLPEKQAEIEAAAKHKKKLERGYALKVEDSGKKYFAPMLAELYKDKETNITFPWVKKIMEDKSIRKFVQPKLDGIRCINSNGVLTSREGKFFVTCPHICQDQPGIILDGELYNHTFKDDFNSIVSMIKQPKATIEELARAKELAQMWVYDFPSHKGTFSERWEAFEKWYGKEERNYPSIVGVPTYKIVSEDELLALHKQFIKQGYEGTIIRIDNAEYEQKRSKQLIKYKDFVDEEFEIVDYVEGKGVRAGMLGKFILKHDVNPSQTFGCDVNGTHEYLTEIWNNRDYYIGKQATVEYQNRTPKKKDGGNVPRFGRIIKLDRKSYE